MQHLVEGNDTQFEWLREQIQGALFIFDNSALPSTCAPNRCRVGFEFTPSKGFTLYIDKHIAYTGTQETFRALLNNGEISFEKYDDMVRFVRGLSGLYTEEEELSRRCTASHQVSHREESFPESQEVQLEAIRQTAQLPIEIDEQELYADLALQIIGQHKALVDLSDATLIHLAKVHPQRPATLFLSGPTGVGKTESVKALVESLNKITDVPFKLIRVDCNTLEESHRISQVLGAPPSYVGYGDPPLLTPLADNPRCVVLWDEIEKAHPNILKALMNAMDTGIMPLPAPINGSNELDCRYSIFIFTSNLSLNFPAKKVGFLTGIQESSPLVISDEDKCKEALVQNDIKPEIAGRIAWFLQYNPLTLEDIEKVIRQEIVKSAREYGVSVQSVDDMIIAEIIKMSGSKFGVRAYKQLIDRRIGKKFAKCEESTTPVAIKGTLDAIEVVPCSPSYKQPELPTESDEGKDIFVDLRKNNKILNHSIK